MTYKRQRVGYRRARYVEATVQLKDTKLGTKAALRLSNVYPEDVKWIDYNRHIWDDVFRSGVIKLKVRKDGEVYIMVFKDGRGIWTFQGDDAKLVRVHFARMVKAWQKYANQGGSRTGQR